MTANFHFPKEKINMSLLVQLFFYIGLIDLDFICTIEMTIKYENNNVCRTLLKEEEQKNSHRVFNFTLSECHLNLP